MKQLSRFFLVAGIIFTVYGFVCRIVPVYFFWSSKVLGIIFLLIALWCFLLEQHKKRKQEGRKTIWLKIGLGFIGFGLIIIPIAELMIKTSGAYQAATFYLKNDPSIKEMVGDVKGFGFMTTGSVTSTTVNGVSSGQAELEIIVKGTKKFKDLTVSLEKNPNTGWVVLSVE